MIGHSALWRKALGRPHTATIRVQVWSGSRLMFDEQAYRPDGTSVWFGGGSVRATLSSRVTRTLKMAVAGRFYPHDPGDVFAPFGNELRVWRGIRFGDNSVEEFDVFYGPITGANQRDDGMVDISAADRALWCLDAGFLAPWTSRQPTADDEFRALVLDAVPDAQFEQRERFVQAVPEQSWENDRGKALDDVATAVGAVWLATPSGRYTLLRLPWTIPDPPTLRRLFTGEDGTVLRALGSRSRDELYNQVAATIERSDGQTSPMRALAADTSPASPTWIGGRFHTKTLHVEVPAATSQGQLQAVADEQLARGKTWTEAFTLRMVPDSTIELADVYDLDADGRSSPQIITSFTMPLDIRSTMSAQTRSPAGIGA